MSATKEMGHRSLRERAGEQESSPALPHIVIVEQPATTATRFRYVSEDRSGGHVIGRNSTVEIPTHLKIKVVGYHGKEKILIVASCVMKDPPHRVHPHNLVGPSCSDGIYKNHLDKTTMSLTFRNLGIQCVKKNNKSVEASLRLRQQKKVDPFRLGFDRNPDSHPDFSCVRICIQAFIIHDKPEDWIPLKPVVTDPIYDKKSTSSSQIQRLSHASASAEGGAEIIILCEKVINKDDVKVVFSEKSTGWQAYGKIILPHKQAAIVVETPRYRNPYVNKNVDVEVKLMRVVDEAFGEPLCFKFIPLESDSRRRKRPKTYDQLQNQALINPYPQPLAEAPTTSNFACQPETSTLLTPQNYPSQGKNSCLIQPHRNQSSANTNDPSLDPSHTVPECFLSADFACQLETSTLWTPQNYLSQEKNFCLIQPHQNQSSANTIHPSFDPSHTAISDQNQQDVTQSSDAIDNIDPGDFNLNEGEIDGIADTLSLFMNISDNI